MDGKIRNERIIFGVNRYKNYHNSLMNIFFIAVLSLGLITMLAINN